MIESAGRGFQAYGNPLEMVTSFKYLGRIFTASDEIWPSVVGNIWKDQKIWDHLWRIMGMEGAIPRVSWIFKRWWCRRI